MHRILRTALLLLFALVPFHSASAAHPPGTVGIFSDPEWTQSYFEMIQYVPATFYVVGFDLDGQVSGFEFSLDMPPGIVVIHLAGEQSSPYFTGPAPVNMGSDTNFIVETGGCVDASGPTLLARFEALSTAPLDPGSTVCLAPSDPSSLSPAAPGYQECDGTSVPFLLVNDFADPDLDGCAILNYQGQICPCIDYVFTIKNTFVPTAGSPVTAPLAIRDSGIPCWGTSDPAKTSCAYPYYVGLSLDLSFDPGQLEWNGISDLRDAQLPYEVTESQPGSIHLDFGSRADRESLISSSWGIVTGDGEVLARLGFTLNQSVETAEVAVSGIVMDDGGVRTLTFQDRSFLISSDRSMPAAELNFGALKARYH